LRLRNLSTYSRWQRLTPPSHRVVIVIECLEQPYQMPGSATDIADMENLVRTTPNVKETGT
jgi:hypothetical protein